VNLIFFKSALGIRIKIINTQFNIKPTICLLVFVFYERHLGRKPPITELNNRWHLIGCV